MFNPAQLTVLLEIGPLGDHVPFHAVVVVKQDHAPSKFHLNLVVLLAQSLEKSKLATLKLALLTVLYLDSPDGLNVTKPAVVVLENEAEKSELQPNSEDKPVQLLNKPDHAMKPHAQLIVLCLLGPNGLFATDHAEVDVNQGLERLSLLQTMVVNYAEPQVTFKNATLNHAQWIVY